MGKVKGYHVGSVVRFWPPGVQRRGELAVIASISDGRYRLHHADGDLVPGQFSKAELLPMAHRLAYGIVGGILAPLGATLLVLLVSLMEMRHDLTREWGSFYPVMATVAVSVLFVGVGMLRIATDPLAPRPLARASKTTSSM